MGGKDDKANWFEEFTQLMDQNIRGVQYAVYSVGIVGLAVALRSVRPFKKFSRPQDIPSNFIEKHMTFNGKVIGLEPPIGNAPPLLLVDHSPVITLGSLRPSKPNLPVHISSLDITTHGLSWLQHIVVGSHIHFTVLNTTPKSVSCIVMRENKNVGVDLVSLGFASVSPLEFCLEKDPLYLRYYKLLLAAENRAEKHGSGIWADNKPSTTSRLIRKMPGAFTSGKHFILNLLKLLRTSSSVTSHGRT